MNRIRSACNGGFIGQWKGGPSPHLIICYIFNRQQNLAVALASQLHHSFNGVGTIKVLDAYGVVSRLGRVRSGQVRSGWVRLNQVESGWVRLG